jgi:arylsulfatase A-like enzyme
LAVKASIAVLAPEGMTKEDLTIATLLKAQRYMTGQFGNNHLGDRDEMLPTAHGFDEFFGNLYHLNAEDEPENPDYPKDPEFKKKFGPRESSTISPAPSRVHSNSAQTISYLMPSGSLKKSA